MIADIATGHTSGADVLFLVAAILAALAVLCTFVPARPAEHGGPSYGWQSMLGWAAVTLIAVAFLLL